MESEDEAAPDLPLPDTPQQSRTLLHYFSKVKPQKNEIMVTSQLDNKIETPEKTEKLSENQEITAACTLSKDESCGNGEMKVENVQNSSVKNKPKKFSSSAKKKKRIIETDQEICEPTESQPAVKKIRRIRPIAVVPDAETENGKTRNDFEEKNTKGINTFFKKVSKDEFRKEVDRQAGNAKLTVKAIVHTPEVHNQHGEKPIQDACSSASNCASSPSKLDASKAKRRRKCSFSNVVRPNSETDTIKVIAEEEIIVGQKENNEINQNELINTVSQINPQLDSPGTTGEHEVSESLQENAETKLMHNSAANGTNKLNHLQNKVSDKLFRNKRRNEKISASLRKSGERIVETSQTIEDSVDVDFFNIQETVDYENDVKLEEEDNKVVSGTSFASTPVNINNTTLCSRSSDDFCDTNMGKLSSKKEQVAKLSNQNIRKQKIVANKKRRNKNNDPFVSESEVTGRSKEIQHNVHKLQKERDTYISKINTVSGENSSDKKATPVSLFKQKDPPKRKYGKRTKASITTNAVNGIAHANYDSDSIDLDLLATYNTKTFHCAASGDGTNNALDSKSDESKNAFSALINKPLTRSQKHLSCVDEPVNAFSALMKGPLTRSQKVSPSCKYSPTNANTKKGRGSHKHKTAHQEALYGTQDCDKENQDTNQGVKKQSLDIPNRPEHPNAFTRLMAAKKSVNLREAVKKKADIKNKADINKSLTDFVEDANSISKSASLKANEKEQLITTRKLRRRKIEVPIKIDKNTKCKTPKRELEKGSNKINHHGENQEYKTYDINYLRISTLWSEKYAPKLGADVIGNSSVVTKLRGWLAEWEERARYRKENAGRCRKETVDYSSSDSDFSIPSQSSFDEDDKLRNTVILVGPNGIGKTAAVYALAHEMGFKVLELNASSTRSGKKVLTNLREATQSHSVKKNEKAKKKGDKPKNSSNKHDPNLSTVSMKKKKSIDKTTLILFEDIDIVFDDLDEGFHAAINSLIMTTKRPIVLTTSSQNFMATNRNKLLNLKWLPEIFEFRPVQPRIIAKYLQLLCLAEGFHINFDSVLGIVLSNNGNIATSIHQLQFWVTLYSNGTQDIPNNQYDNFVVELKSAPLMEDSSPKTDEHSSVTVRKEDSLAKLMSINVERKNVETPKYSLVNCSLSLIGLELDDAEKNSWSNILQSREKNLLLLNKCEVLNKLLSAGFFYVFDWNRHNLLPFRRMIKPKGQARSAHYPLTMNSYSSDSAVTSNTVENIGERRTKVLEKSYKRILNNDSLFMTESGEEDNSTTAQTSELDMSGICGGGKIKINTSPTKNEKCTSLTPNGMASNLKEVDVIGNTTNCTEFTQEGSNMLIKNAEETAVEKTKELKIPANEKETKILASQNVKQAIEILSEYTDCLSNFLPLQEEPPFWLTSSHKDSSCTSQLCANSDYYESCMISTNKFKLAGTYGSTHNHNYDTNSQAVAQDIIANMTHLSVQRAQNSIAKLLPKESDALELSMYCSCLAVKEGILNEKGPVEAKGDQLFECQCARHINEEMTTFTIECDDSNKKCLFSRDLICEASMNKDFERGFDGDHVKQLHNAQREVLESSFFSEPTVNIRRPLVLDALPVIRGMARMEEFRKASGLGCNKKRTSRSKFLHYFQTQDLYSMRSQMVLNTLCNSLQR